LRLSKRIFTKDGRTDYVCRLSGSNKCNATKKGCDPACPILALAWSKLGLFEDIDEEVDIDDVTYS
jgi:hypothetical protein